jgi:hypothetical protein
MFNLDHNGNAINNSATIRLDPETEARFLKCSNKK